MSKKTPAGGKHNFRRLQDKAEQADTDGEITISSPKPAAVGATQAGKFFKASKSAKISPSTDGNDDPDRGPFETGMSEEEYLLKRAEAIAEKRGIEKDKPFDPQLRIDAIQQMERQEVLLAGPLTVPRRGQRLARIRSRTDKLLPPVRHLYRGERSQSRSIRRTRISPMSARHKAAFTGRPTAARLGRR